MLIRGSVFQNTQQPCHCTTANPNTAQRLTSTTARATSRPATGSVGPAATRSRMALRSRPAGIGITFQTVHDSRAMA